MPRLLPFLLLTFLSLAAANASAEEPKWGDFTGQLIYDGEPPECKKLNVKKGFPETFDEWLVVDPETHGIANVFVYLRTSKDATEPLRVHPDYAERLKQPVQVRLDERGFTPHCFVVHTEQTFIIAHRGKVAFNVKGDLFKNGSFGILIPPQADGEYHFQTSESLPSTLGCNIHAWFRAYLLVRDNPYMAVTDGEGRFTIKNLPVGEHEFQFWQEKVGYVQLPEVRLHDTAATGNRAKGRLAVPIQPGENDLGAIKLDPQQFD